MRKTASGLAISAGAVIVGGIVVMVLSWRDGGWFDLARLAVVMGGQLAVSAYFAGKRGTVDDAFQAGYDAGFHKGERCRPKIIRLDRERASRS